LDEGKASSPPHNVQKEGLFFTLTPRQRQERQHLPSTQRDVLGRMKISTIEDIPVKIFLKKINLDTFQNKPIQG
jgi:hypothetical protein